MRIVRGIVLYLSLVVAATAMFALISPVYLTIFIHSKRVIRLRRWYCDLLSSVYLDFAAALLTSSLCGTKVYLYSNDAEVLNDRGTLMLSNHRCRVDWMYSGFCYNSALNSNGQLRFVLKSSIRGVPIFGWIMSCMMYLFVTRKDRNEDLDNMGKVTKYLLHSGGRPNIFLFPEGTDLTESSLIKAHDHAKSHNLPVMNYVLVPKVSGVERVLNELRGHGGAVHDITVAYKDYNLGGKGDIRPSEVSMWKGEFPQEVHLCVKRYEMDQLPTKRPELEKWVFNSFEHKEKLLASYYENDSSIPTAEYIKDATKRVDQKTSTNEEKDKKIAAMEAWPQKIPLTIKVWQPLMIVYIVWIFGVGAAAYMFSAVRWYLIIITVYSALARAIGNGFDLIELYLHSNLTCETKSRSLSDTSIGSDDETKKKK
jgi:lysocardiolipin and lysophospholipid acyltransferase